MCNNIRVVDCDPLTSFLDWTYAWGTLNGLAEGGPCWWTLLPSGACASVWLDADSAESYSLLVTAEPPADPTCLWGGYGPWGGDLEPDFLFERCGFGLADWPAVAVEAGLV